jgi:putative PIN family toxin of toxin-antitoxin system
MPIKKHRVVIDTNLWISFLISRKFETLDSFFKLDSITLIFSEQLLEEFVEVAKRPKFEKYFSLSDLMILLNSIYPIAEFVEVTSNVEICRDKNDNFLLSLSKDSNANYLVSGDKDLLEIQKFGKTRIVTMSEFLSLKKHHR